MSKAVYFIVLHNRHSLSLKCYNQSTRHLSTENGKTIKLLKQLQWNKWIPISTGVGITVLGALQMLRKHRSDQPPVSLGKELEITCYRSLPLRVWSRVWGLLSSLPIPPPLRPSIYGLYSKFYGVNLDEMVGSFKDYPSLSKFFTRELKPGIRPIDSSDLVSPADAKVLNCGKLSSCYVEQVKGATYKIQTLLGEPTWHPSSKKDEKKDENDNIANNKIEVQKHSNSVSSVIRNVFKGSSKAKTATEEWKDYRLKLLTNPNNELYQVILYLSPKDYHRFHSPAQWHVNFRRHFQGELLSVNPLIASWVPGLYSLNERVVYTGKWKYGFFSMVIIGATSVGSIKVYCDKTLETNTRKWRDGTTHKDKVMDCNWKKGEEVGLFTMGSSIILIFEAPKETTFDFKSIQRVKVGQALSVVRRGQED